MEILGNLIRIDKKSWNNKYLSKNHAIFVDMCGDLFGAFWKFRCVCCFWWLFVAFIDVWHGNGFINYSKDHFRSMRRYEYYFVPSKYWKKIYNQQRGFEQKKIMVTGLAKHDIFFNSKLTRQSIKKDLSLTIGSKFSESS